MSSHLATAESTFNSESVYSREISTVRLAAEGTWQNDINASEAESTINRTRTPRPLAVKNANPRFERIKQQWSGVVLSVQNESVVVRLKNQTDKGQPDEEVTLSVEEFDDQDLSLLKQGAMLNWYIGYRQGSGYPKESFSKISIRRLPSWSAAEIRDAEKQADIYADYLFGDS